MPQPRFYCVPLTIVVAIAATLAAAPLQAQNAATFAIALPAQPLGSALNELARQASFQLIVHPELVAGKSAPAVSGSLSAQQALERLLAGSGLQAAQEGRVVVVKPVPKAETVTRPIRRLSIRRSRSRSSPTTNCATARPKPCRRRSITRRALPASPAASIARPTVSASAARMWSPPPAARCATACGCKTIRHRPRAHRARGVYRRARLRQDERRHACDRL